MKKSATQRLWISFSPFFLFLNLPWCDIIFIINTFLHLKKSMWKNLEAGHEQKEPETWHQLDSFRMWAWPSCVPLPSGRGNATSPRSAKAPQQGEDSCQNRGFLTLGPGHFSLEENWPVGGSLTVIRASGAPVWLPATPRDSLLWKPWASNLQISPSLQSPWPPI